MTMSGQEFEDAVGALTQHSFLMPDGNELGDLASTVTAAVQGMIENLRDVRRGGSAASGMKIPFLWFPESGGAYDVVVTVKVDAKPAKKK